ncbi:unnamed protein product [Caenorhabditis brenneri]
MGGSNSKNSFFDEPSEYQPVELSYFSFWNYLGKEWRLKWDEWGDNFEINCFFLAKTRVEFIYQFVLVYNSRIWRKKKKHVVRGVGELIGPDSSYEAFHDSFDFDVMSTYEQMSFQAIAHVFLDGKMRLFNFYDNIFGEAKVIDIDGQELAVPMKAVIKRAPLLAIQIEKDKLSQKLKMQLNDFLQIMHGVQIQLTDKNLIGILKLSVKYKVFNVKRYCEYQLIRRYNFEFSEKKKFKMACKYDLNILMNQVLRNVRTVKKLAKLVSIAIEMESMDTNIFKLLIAKMYQIS